MSRKEERWDNAAESFSSSSKKERIKKQIYENRERALTMWPTALIASTIDPATTVKWA